MCPIVGPWVPSVSIRAQADLRIYARFVLVRGPRRGYGRDIPRASWGRRGDMSRVLEWVITHNVYDLNTSYHGRWRE